MEEQKIIILIPKAKNFIWSLNHSSTLFDVYIYPCIPTRSKASGQSTFKIYSESDHFPSTSLQPLESKSPSIISHLYYWNSSLTVSLFLYLPSFNLFSHNSQNDSIKISDKSCHFSTQISLVALHLIQFKNQVSQWIAKPYALFSVSSILFQPCWPIQFSSKSRGMNAPASKRLHLFSLPVLLFLNTSAPFAHFVSLIQSFLLCVPSVATPWKECMYALSTFLLLSLFSLALTRILLLHISNFSFYFPLSLFFTER